MPGRSGDNVGPTKHPSAFRLNKKEVAEIAEAAAQVEATALGEGVAAEEAKAIGEAKTRELTRLKQEERWQRSKDKHAAGLGKGGGDDEDDGTEPPEPGGLPSLTAVGRSPGGKPADSRRSSGGGAATPTTNHNYYVKLGDAVNLILKHRDFKGISDAEPMEISGDAAVSSGVQARKPHTTVLAVFLV